MCLQGKEPNFSYPNSLSRIIKTTCEKSGRMTCAASGQPGKSRVTGIPADIKLYQVITTVLYLLYFSLSSLGFFCGFSPLYRVGLSRVCDCALIRSRPFVLRVVCGGGGDHVYGLEALINEQSPNEDGGSRHTSYRSNGRNYHLCNLEIFRNFQFEIVFKSRLCHFKDSQPFSFLPFLGTCVSFSSLPFTLFTFSCFCLLFASF